VADTEVALIETAGVPTRPAEVMGIVNITPDSFSDGGRFADSQAAIDHGRQLRAEGATILDIGGESSRPGADTVPVEEELARVVPVVEGLAGVAPLAIDTRKPEVARAAVAAGASMINDVSATLAEVAAELSVPYVVMHMQGNPQTMQNQPTYTNVVDEVLAFLVGEAERAVALGVPEVWIDPGVGFGKTLEHNMSLLKATARFVASGFPVLVGASRKSFVGKVLGHSDAGTWGDAIDTAAATHPSVPTDQRLEGSVAVATWAVTAGAHAVRVHDVRPTAQAVRVISETI
jgi:dihydropteroate synthase